MGVKIRKLRGKWYLVIDYRGKRKTRVIGTDHKIAEQVRRQVEAKLALGDVGILLDNQEPASSTFGEYTGRWMEEYAQVENKPSTVVKHEQVLRLYLLPQFGTKPLASIRRDEVKAFLAALASGGKLSRNSMRLILSTLRVILNHAVEDGLLDRNPAEKLGRFTKVDAEQKVKAAAMSRDEADRFLKGAQENFPDFYPLFLTALRAGLRRGELIALKWGDIQFGASEDDSNRYLLVQRSWVYGSFTSPKSKKSRRVDLSRQLRRVLLELRDKRLLGAFLSGKSSLSDELIFPSEVGTVLQPENLYHRYFLPCLESAGLHRFRFHDLRHTFGSLLIQDGASLTYVKEQMGHSSIQVTVDTYGHLIPGADIAWVDRLDSESRPQISANRTQTPNHRVEAVPVEVIDLLGGPGGIRTPDQGIMSPLLYR